jgi:hypothetical protein
VTGEPQPPATRKAGQGKEKTGRNDKQPLKRGTTKNEEPQPNKDVKKPGSNAA